MTEPAPFPAPVVVLSRPYAPEPTGIQPLIEGVLGRRRVLWVNFVGAGGEHRSLARLRAGFRSIRRRAHQTSGPPAAPLGADAGPEESRLRVIDPLVQPGGSAGFGSAARRRLLARTLDPAIERLGQPPVVVTTLPHTAELIDAFPARRWVYYMLEGEADAVPPALAELEAEQLRAVDAVAAATPGLARRAAEAGREAAVMPPGVDAGWWAPAEIDPPRSRAARRLDALPEPRALYWGPPDADLDPRLLQDLAGRWEGAIALIGPSRSRSHSAGLMNGVHWLGPAPEADLPRIATLADVLILPHPAGSSDRIAPPAQLLPYLATGRATVCRDAPALRPWAECCDLVPPERFADRVAQRAVTGPSAEQLAARQRRLPAESWDARLARFEALLDPARPVIRVPDLDIPAPGSATVGPRRPAARRNAGADPASP